MVLVPICLTTKADVNTEEEEDAFVEDKLAVFIECFEYWPVMQQESAISNDNSIIYLSDEDDENDNTAADAYVLVGEKLSLSQGGSGDLRDIVINRNQALWMMMMPACFFSDEDDEEEDTFVEEKPDLRDVAIEQEVASESKGGSAYFSDDNDAPIDDEDKDAARTSPVITTVIKKILLCIIKLLQL